MLREVLLVDDEDTDNYIHRRVIEGARVVQSVSTCTSTDEAIDYLRRHPGASPDLVFLDINMPGKDGWEFLEEFEQLPDDCRGSVVVVMLTSSQHREDRSTADRQEKVRGYITKPLTEAALLEVLAQHFPDSPPST